jgi:hypothetical protein
LWGDFSPVVLTGLFILDSENFFEELNRLVPN